MNPVVISLQRDKCIGCNFCAEVAPSYFVISKKDGKSNLLKSTGKKGIYVTKLNSYDNISNIERAAQGCPVRIIKINNKVIPF